jgi:hypothetical protein
LLDHGRADVGRPGDGRRIAELRADHLHHGRNAPVRLRLGLWRTVLGERDGCDQRPAPGPKVLRGELLSEMGLDVFVQASCTQVVDLAVELVPE